MSAAVRAEALSPSVRALSVILSSLRARYILRALSEGSIVLADGNWSFAGDIYGFVVMTVPFNGQISL